MLITLRAYEGFPGVTRRHSSGCGRQVNVRMPLLVTTPCVDYREYPRLHVRLTADFQYHIRCDTAHLCQQPPVVEYQGPVMAGSVNTICCHGLSGTRLSRYCIHCAPAFIPQCGQERLLHRKQTFLCGNSPVRNNTTVCNPSAWSRTP